MPLIKIVYILHQKIMIGNNISYMSMFEQYADIDIISKSFTLYQNSFLKQLKRFRLMFLYLATLHTVCIVIVIILHYVELIFIPLLLQ